jgi:hypothetical protein
VTAPTVAALAREIADALFPGFKNNELEAAEVAAILTRAWPVGRAVVEVTASTLAGAHGRASITDRPGSHWDRMAAEINTTLRARAPQSDTVACRVVRRKTTTVSALKTPKECGVADRTYIVYENRHQNSYYFPAAEWMDTSAEHGARWCVPGQPWVERTTTEVPQAWTEEMVPKDGQLFVWVTTDGDPQLARRDRAAHTLHWFNRHIVAFYPLSEDLP